MDKILEDYSKKIEHIFDRYHSLYKSDTLSGRSEYIGYTINDNMIVITYEKTYPSFYNDDDDEETRNNINIIVAFDCLDMDDEELKKYFAKELKREEYENKIKKHNNNIESDYKDIEKYYHKIAKVKSPNYIKEKIEHYETIIQWRENDIKRAKEWIKEYEELLK